METLRSKRNAVLKSAILEQVQIPFIHKRSSQQSSGSMEIEEEEEESMEMEVESDINHNNSVKVKHLQSNKIKNKLIVLISLH